MILLKLAELLKLDFHGNPNCEINGVCSLKKPLSGKILYISSHKLISNEIYSADAFLIDKKLQKYFPNQNLLLSSNPQLSFTELTKVFLCPKSDLRFDKDKQAFIGKNVTFGLNIEIGKGTVIEDNVIIGNNVKISHNVTICSRVIIGDNVIIGPGTVIGSEGFGNVFTGKNWEHITHLGSVEIMNNSCIGANCTIDRGTIDNTVISSGVIIDNQVHIAHNVFIGSNTAIAAKVGIAGSCNIGKRNMIGGMVGIVDHIDTADDVTVSATSTVNTNLNEPGVYTGIMPISKHFRWKRIALWITKLDKITKFLKLKKI